MRILTLLAGGEVLPEVVGLTDEIRAFNAEIDFRLRFLHIEISAVYAAEPSVIQRLEEALERPDLRPVRASDPLQAAAELALLLTSVRPDVVLIAGEGPLVEPGAAAARACDVKLACFAGPCLGQDAIDLGASAPVAVELLTGVAREIG